ncbi:hypothetical protein J7K42_02825 [bacterium]|nr:hypothetical protein [bacterium]
MLKVLGILDIIAALLLLAALSPDTPKGLVIVVASLICLKGFIFIFDPVSIFDVGVGILLFLSLFIILPFLLLFIVAGVLIVKGVLSLAA